MKRVISSDDYYEEIEEEEVAEIQTQQGVELKLANGNIIKAPTYEEALKVAVKMTEDTQAALKAEREAASAKTQELEARVNELANQIPKPAPAANGNGFDNQRYWQLLNSDPLAAQNYLDSVRFGIGNPEAVPGYFQRMDERINNFDQQMLASQFIYQHEEFPATPENAAILTKQVEELVKAGHPASIETLNMAWGHVVETGKIKPLEVTTQETEEAPPSLPGGGGQEIMPDDKFEKMSTQEMEAYLKSQGRI